MRRPILMVLLSLGAFFGFTSGIAHLSHAGWSRCSAHERWRESVTEVPAPAPAAQVQVAPAPAPTTVFVAPSYPPYPPQPAYPPQAVYVVPAPAPAVPAAPAAVPGK